MARFAAQARVQSQFLDDASHQLRTPLSVLRTQTAYALRETDPRRSVQPFWRCRRAWTGPCVPPTRCWPWRAPGRLPGRRWVRARAGRPGRDGERRYPHPAAGGPYPPAGRGHGCAARTGQGAGGRLAVAGGGQQSGGQRHPLQPAGRGPDGPGASRGRDGKAGGGGQRPGMSAEDIARACVRFRRGAAGKNKPGAGLGLAIVGTIAEILGAKLVLENRAPQAGCARRWCLPWKTPWMLRRITKITEFERCWKGSVLYGCVRGASRAAHGTAGRQGGHRTQTYKFWRRNNADPLEAAPGRRHGAGRLTLSLGAAQAAAEPRRPECIAPPSPAAAST